MTNPPASRLSLLMTVGMFVLAVVGVGLLALAIFTLTRPQATEPTALPTLAFTSVVSIPTTTPAPPTNTPEPTATASQVPTEPPPTEVPPTTVVVNINIVQPANVRNGPGTNYTQIGGLAAGVTMPAIGRNDASDWFAFSFQQTDGQTVTGWVSNLVATADGDLASLPVLSADAPPSGPVATQPPAAAPTNTNPPPANTQPPAPTATQQLGARGIVANSFTVENAQAAPGQDVWFNFDVKNTSQSAVSYGVLAAHTDAGVTAQSWTNESLDPGETLTWRDHINFPNAGTYQLYLGICFSDKNSCLNGAGWDHLSNSITIVIQ